ncbi:EAL domain-containing protein (putative c-di-GMP-specific phosphodiesterase class I) [Paenibacillus endophyticus]|uniref:EAL domain-containing protein (Putative c-di-GMP-specific phosphodiesterase class I) n=1 Tax=Paenibacillus endophyticus TaxID=1294268 RepID=A0A7W5C5V6_9BACL|nr:EAL domain-containing protein [Paenibacillus endophyticus]MBB3151492.1 EAL domain-containing protein (putative c-di-GMP-specific phosphodiesterase class I) [Paenibacillus endophyticus]
MRQVRDIWRLNGADNESTGHLGIIYLSWQLSSDDQKDSMASLQERWREFAEREAEEAFNSSLLYEGLQWVKEDLFIHMRLPTGKAKLLEGWLLELAHKHTTEWEQRFVEGLDKIASDSTEARLHVGVAVASNESNTADGLVWYEVMKKAILHGQAADAMEHSMKRRAIDQIICDRMIYPVYQPIVSLQKQGKIFGYESLTRTVDRSWFAGPMDLFLFAEKEGLTYTLDRLAREKAIDGCISLAPDQKLFINVMAQIMEDPSFSPGQTLSLLEQHKLSPHHVVFEITERNSIADFGTVKKALEHYRSQGYQIAIDDVGAGYSSLQSIVELRPDYLKVDRSIVQNIHLDEMKEHILYTLIQLALKMDISVIAEGIELEEELAKVREMGVQYAQGYLLGRPAPFDTNKL